MAMAAATSTSSSDRGDDTRIVTTVSADALPSLLFLAALEVGLPKLPALAPGMLLPRVPVLPPPIIILEVATPERAMPPKNKIARVIDLTLLLSFLLLLLVLSCSAVPLVSELS